MIQCAKKWRKLCDCYICFTTLCYKDIINKWNKNWENLFSRSYSPQQFMFTYLFHSPLLLNHLLLCLAIWSTLLQNLKKSFFSKCFLLPKSYRQSFGQLCNYPLCLKQLGIFDFSRVIKKCHPLQVNELRILART